MKNIFRALEIIYEANLCANKVMILHCLLVRLNKNFWNPVSISGATLGRGMAKDTFLKERKELVASGWIEMRPGQWKTAQPMYRLGQKFIDTNDKTEKVRSREDIKKLVIEIDKQYPDFTAYCAKHKWDKAVELFKAEHPELTSREWPIDLIGDPVNRQQAHEMLIKLHKRKSKLLSKSDKKEALQSEVWQPFLVFVEMWRLTYPKKAARAAIISAVNEFTKDKELWSAEQVKALQEAITAHSTAYTASFNGDYTYMVSPVNYFAAEKWTEKIAVKTDKRDVTCKTAGAPVKPNLPKITTIKAGTSLNKQP